MRGVVRPQLYFVMRRMSITKCYWKRTRGGKAPLYTASRRLSERSVNMKNKENEKIKKENTCRTIVNVPIDMDNKFRELAVKRGIAKSQMILFAMGWYLEHTNTLDLFPKMIETLINAENVLKKERSKEFVND